MAPTRLPTRQPIELLCVSFAYTLENTTGYTAADIFNEVNNTIKERLIAATKTVTIDILNSTQPKLPNPSLNRHLMAADYRGFRNQAIQCALLEHFGPWQEVQHMLVSSPKHSDEPVRREKGPGIIELRARRLAIFSDESRVEITSVLDSMFCVNPLQDCVVVSSTVCVVLEASDDPELVRTNLVQGFRESIDGGGFNEVIPR
jgi:hypothetical protein